MNKADAINSIFDDLNSAYTRESGLRGELVASLAKKLSRQDIDQLAAVVAMSRPEEPEPKPADSPLVEVWRRALLWWTNPKNTDKAREYLTAARKGKASGWYEERLALDALSMIVHDAEAQS